MGQEVNVKCGNSNDYQQFIFNTTFRIRSAANHNRIVKVSNNDLYEKLNFIKELAVINADQSLVNLITNSKYFFRSLTEDQVIKLFKIICNNPTSNNNNGLEKFWFNNPMQYVVIKQLLKDKIFGNSVLGYTDPLDFNHHSDEQKFIEFLTIIFSSKSYPAISALLEAPEFVYEEKRWPHVSTIKSVVQQCGLEIDPKRLTAEANIYWYMISHSVSRTQAITDIRREQEETNNLTDESSTYSSTYSLSH